MCKKNTKRQNSVALDAEAVERARSRVRAIRSPEDIKPLAPQEIVTLCDDLRRVLIDRTGKNGGHLASNLGAVELTVAIHRVFDAPRDHIIFDVGHQSYVHKLLTGRAEAFDTLRQPGGLSGFPRRAESEYDAFGTGHASTSISAGLGFARADHLNDSDAYTVVVLGDGALTGGMIHEALNNCDKQLRLIIVLNENEMSISKNVGRFAQLLTKLRTARGYSRTKSVLETILDGLPLLGKPLLRALRGIKRCFKRLVYRSNYFESMGLNYFGPIDGNDERQVERLLQAARAKEGCSLVHLRTVKGKGYACAEHDPDLYHGLSPSGRAEQTPASFSDVFGMTLTRLAAHDERLCAITAAMRQGTGLSPFYEAHPARFFDVGIAEEHALTYAAGLATGGMLPVVAIYSTFLQRAYDQILHDVALQQLPVLIAIDRAGLSAADGATHHGIYDVSFLSHIPGVDIYEPPTTAALSHLLERLIFDGVMHPVAIRYPSGHDNERILTYVEQGVESLLCDGVYADFDPARPPRTAVVTYGRVTAQVLEAVDRADEPIGVVLLGKLRPWNGTVEALAALCQNGVENIIFCEEGVRTGGLGQTLSCALREALPTHCSPYLRVLAIDEREGEIPMPTVGQTAWEAVGLDHGSLLNALNELK